MKQAFSWLKLGWVIKLYEDIRIVILSIAKSTKNRLPTILPFGGTGTGRSMSASGG